jgi:hypothetical protein
MFVTVEESPRSAQDSTVKFLYSLKLKTPPVDAWGGFQLIDLKGPKSKFARISVMLLGRPKFSGPPTNHVTNPSIIDRKQQKHENAKIIITGLPSPIYYFLI